MYHSIIVSAQRKFKFDCLLEAFEAPVALLFFKCWYSQELIDCFARVFCFQLLGIVIFVLDINVAISRLVSIVLIIEIIPAELLA